MILAAMEMVCVVLADSSLHALNNGSVVYYLQQHWFLSDQKKVFIHIFKCSVPHTQETDPSCDFTKGVRVLFVIEVSMNLRKPTLNRHQEIKGSAFPCQHFRGVIFSNS